MLGEAADHVEDDPGLPGLVEVQAVSRDDVEQVADGQRPESVVLEVVGGDQVLLLPLGVRNTPRSPS